MREEDGGKAYDWYDFVLYCFCERYYVEEAGDVDLFRALEDYMNSGLKSTY